MQQELRDAVLATFPELELDDVRSTSMGASGTDLLLSPAAQRRFPYYVECGYQERINIWEKIAQAENAASPLRPLLVFRRNHSPTYAVVRLDELLALRRVYASS